MTASLLGLYYRLKIFYRNLCLSGFIPARKDLDAHFETILLQFLLVFKLLKYGIVKLEIV
jgi:hypothetical protein